MNAISPRLLVWGIPVTIGFPFAVLAAQSDFELPVPYCCLEAGYRWRFEEPLDKWRFFELGGNFNPRFYTREKIDRIFSVHNGKETAPVRNISLTPEYDLITLQTTLGMNLGERWGIETCYIPTVHGKNTAAGYTLSTAVIDCF
jgi:hypothetical protein